MIDLPEGKNVFREHKKEDIEKDLQNFISECFKNESIFINISYATKEKPFEFKTKLYAHKIKVSSVFSILIDDIKQIKETGDTLN